MTEEAGGSADDALSTEQTNQRPSSGTPGVADARASLHRPARAILKHIERRGISLNAEQVRALDRIVPPALSDDEVVDVLQRLIDDGDAIPQGAYEVLGIVDRAVRERHEPMVSVKVNGKERQDLGSAIAAQQPAAGKGSGRTGTRKGHEHTRKPKARRSGRGTAAARSAPDLATIVYQLPEAVLESWLSYDATTGRLITSEFDAWAIAHRNADVRGEPPAILWDASMDVQDVGPDEWRVVVSFTLSTERKSYTFYIGLDANDRPYVDGVIVGEVRPSRR